MVKTATQNTILLTSYSYFGITLILISNNTALGRYSRRKYRVYFSSIQPDLCVTHGQTRFNYMSDVNIVGLIIHNSSTLVSWMWIEFTTEQVEESTLKTQLLEMEMMRWHRNVTHIKKSSRVKFDWLRGHSVCSVRQLGNY